MKYKIIHFLAFLLVLCVSQVFALTQKDIDKIKSSLNLAFQAHNKGNYQEAEIFHRQALNLMREVDGMPEVEIARQMSNLAAVLNLKGKSQEALKLTLKAKNILENNPSDDPIQYASLYWNLAKAQTSMGNLEMAESNFFEAWKIVESVMGLENEFIADYKAGLAYIWTQQGKHEKALKFYIDSLEFYRKYLNSEHPIRSKVESEYQLLLRKMQPDKQR